MYDGFNLPPPEILLNTAFSPAFSSYIRQFILHCREFLYLLLIRNSKIIQIGLKAVLGGEAGIHKETLFVIPFFEATVVE